MGCHNRTSSMNSVPFPKTDTSSKFLNGTCHGNFYVLLIKYVLKLKPSTFSHCRITPGNATEKKDVIYSKRLSQRRSKPESILIIIVFSQHYARNRKILANVFDLQPFPLPSINGLTFAKDPPPPAPQTILRNFKSIPLTFIAAN